MAEMTGKCSTSFSPGGRRPWGHRCWPPARDPPAGHTGMERPQPALQTSCPRTFSVCFSFKAKAHISAGSGGWGTSASRRGPRRRSPPPRRDLVGCAGTWWAVWAPTPGTGRGGRACQGHKDTRPHVLTLEPSLQLRGGPPWCPLQQAGPPGAPPGLPGLRPLRGRRSCRAGVRGNAERLLHAKF